VQRKNLTHMVNLSTAYPT